MVEMMGPDEYDEACRKLMSRELGVEVEQRPRGVKFGRPLPETFEEFLEVQTEPPGIIAWCDRWAVREHELPQFHEAFSTGDKSAVLFALYRCLECEVPIPDWVAEAFVAECAKVAGFQVGTWDEAFGRPRPKGTHLATKRKHASKGWRVYLDVSLQLRQAGQLTKASLKRSESGTGWGKHWQRSCTTRRSGRSTSSEDFRLFSRFCGNTFRRLRFNLLTPPTTGKREQQQWQRGTCNQSRTSPRAVLSLKASFAGSCSMPNGTGWPLPGH